MHPEYPPIIVVTHTNHVLDQILTHIAKFEPKYIRIGGRSRNAKVLERTLFAIKDNQRSLNLPNGLLHRARRKHVALINDIIQNTLKGFDKQGDASIGSIFIQHELRTKEQLVNLERGSNEWVTCTTTRLLEPLIAWLGEQATPFDGLNTSNYSSKVIEDFDQDYEVLMGLEEKELVDSNGIDYLKGKMIDLRRAFPCR